MLVPAILYKEQIKTEFQKKFYSMDMLYETGCNSQWCPEISDEPEEGVFEYAIINGRGKLIGYLSYQVDYYSSNAYNFGLMSFDRGNPIIGKVLFEKMEELVSTMHRVEWRMIGGNPVERHYDRFCAKYGGAKYILHDSVRDKNGKYHDNVVYEIIRLMDTLSENENLKEKEKFGCKVKIVGNAEEYNEGWILCSEKLPENDDNVLCWYEYRIMGGTHEGEMNQEYGIGYYNKYYKSWGGEASSGRDCKVIAWQPLPEPYKESE